MTRSRIAGLAVTILLAGALAPYGYRRWRGSSDGSPRDELLAQMPADATAVLYVDLDELRHSPFLAELYRWVPQSKDDADYTQFLQSTGFNYESDLNRVAVAVWQHGKDTALFAVAEGRFDRKKISAYASQSGTHENRNGREIFYLPLNGTARRITFTFLRTDEIALTNGVDLESSLAHAHADADVSPWRDRFRRLAGSPVFAVLRQDASAGAASSSQTPGGLHSPQLSALIDQLTWITIAGKPAGDRLRVVLEGEAAAEANARQLADLINGLLVLAQAGLSDQKMRQQLQPQVRQAYMEMLRSADVSQIDRGETKSVRLIFDVTPEFLEAARAASPVVPSVPQNKVPASKSTIRN